MPEDIHSSLKTVAKGTILIFISTVLGTLLWFASKLLIVHNFTKEQLGIYSLALAISGMISTLAGAGIPDGATRFISVFLGQGKKKDADAVTRASLQIGIATGLAATAIIYFFAPLLARHIFYMPSLAVPLRAVSFFALFNTMLVILVGILRGHGDINPQIYNVSIGQPLLFFILAGVCFILKLGFIFIIYAYLAAVILLFLSVWVYGQRKIGLNLVGIGGARHKKELLGLSLPLLGASLMNQIFTWSDTFVLGRYTGAEAVGVYSVSLALTKLLLFVPGAMIFVFMPLAGDLYSRGQIPELKRIYQVLTKWVFMGTMPIFFVLFSFPEMTISFLFGKQYMESALPLRVLSVGFMANVFFGASTIVLVIMGVSKTLLKVETFGAVLNLGLNYLLVKRMGYGVNGACTATTISMCLIYGIYALILYKKSRIHALTGNYLKPFISLVFVGLAVYGLVKSLPLHLWMVPLYFVLFLTLYGFVLLLTRSIEKEDAKLFEAVVKRTGLELKFARRLVNKFGR